MRRPEKHIPFFSVVDAARSPGCMLCRLISSRTRKYLETLLYENVNDVGFREEWRASKGFCHRHAWMLADSQDALGIAILYQDLIGACGQELLAGKMGGDCPVCEAEDHALDNHIGTLLQYADDDELRSAIRGSDGLCVPHLRAVMRRLRNADLRQAFADVSARGMKKLHTELGQLIESFDYRHAPPTKECVKLAWRRAIETLVGHRDVPRTEKEPT
jgi:hypothetical protein